MSTRDRLDQIARQLQSRIIIAGYKAGLSNQDPEDKLTAFPAYVTNYGLGQFDRLFPLLPIRGN